MQWLDLTDWFSRACAEAGLAFEKSSKKNQHLVCTQSMVTSIVKSRGYTGDSYDSWLV